MAVLLTPMASPRAAVAVPVSGVTATLMCPLPALPVVPAVVPALRLSVIPSDAMT